MCFRQFKFVGEDGLTWTVAHTLPWPCWGTRAARPQASEGHQDDAGSFGRPATLHAQLLRPLSGRGRGHGNTTLSIF